MGRRFGDCGLRGGIYCVCRWGGEDTTATVDLALMGIEVK